MRPAPPAYKIIFNHDGTFLGKGAYPMSVETLLDKVYGPLEGTQVGALTWCVGTEEATWKSDTLPMYGDSMEGRALEVANLTRYENLRAMLDRGDDLYGDMVRRGRDLGMDVFCAVRMNDNHFWSDKGRKAEPLKPEDMAKTFRSGLTQFRKDHPEWVLGEDNAPRWAATSWNLAYPEVREERLRYVTEACEQADWDGLEVDWQRHAFHLPENDAYRLRYTITDLMRAIRRMTDTLAEKRGRPFYVLARVGASMETNRRIGYDVETWIEEGLCDIVATNANSGTDPGVEIEEYLRMMEGTNVALYPGFDSHGEGGQGRLIPATEWLTAWFRGLATGYYDRGAKGVHIFNWHNETKRRRPMLETVGEAATLEGKDKVYAAVNRIIRSKSEIRYGAERDDRLLGETPVALYETITGDGPTFHIRVHDNLEAVSEALKGVQLMIELDHHAPDDVVIVRLDGEELPAPAVRNTAAENAGDPSDVAESSWLVWDLEPGRAARGTHEIQTVLVARDARLRTEIVVKHVEMWVRYR